MASESLPKFMFLHEDSQEMTDKRIRTLQTYKEINDNKVEKVLTKRVNNTISTPLKPNSQGIFNLEYSNKYRLLLQATQDQILVINQHELQSDLLTGKQNPKTEQKIEFSGEIFLSPSEEILAVYSQSLIQFLFMDKLPAITCPPIAKKHEHHRFLWLTDSEILLWGFLEGAILISINPKTLEKVSQVPLQGVSECTGASIVGTNLLVCQKLQIFAYQLGKNKLLKRIDLNYEGHGWMYYEYSYIVQIFRVNVHKSPFEINTRLKVPLDKEDILGLVMVFYDDQDYQNNERCLTFFRGNLLEGGKDIRGNQNFYVAQDRNQLYFQEEKMLPFGVKVAYVGCFICVMVERSATVYVVDPFQKFQVINIYSPHGKLDFKAAEGKFFKGMGIMKNMLPFEKKVPADVKTGILHTIVKDFDGQFMSLYFADQETNLTIPFPASVIALTQSHLYRRYAISSLGGIEKDQDDEIIADMQVIKRSPYLQTSDKSSEINSALVVRQQRNIKEEGTQRRGQRIQNKSNFSFNKANTNLESQKSTKTMANEFSNLFAAKGQASTTGPSILTSLFAAKTETDAVTTSQNPFAKSLLTLGANNDAPKTETQAVTPSNTAVNIFGNKVANPLGSKAEEPKAETQTVTHSPNLTGNLLGTKISNPFGAKTEALKVDTPAANLFVNKVANPLGSKAEEPKAETQPITHSPNLTGNLLGTKISNPFGAKTEALKVDTPAANLFVNKVANPLGSKAEEPKAETQPITTSPNLAVNSSINFGTKTEAPKTETETVKNLPTNTEAANTLSSVGANISGTNFGASNKLSIGTNKAISKPISQLQNSTPDWTEKKAQNKLISNSNNLSAIKSPLAETQNISQTPVEANKQLKQVAPIKPQGQVRPPHGNQVATLSIINQTINELKDKCKALKEQKFGKKQLDFQDLKLNSEKELDTFKKPQVLCLGGPLAKLLQKAESARDNYLYYEQILQSCSKDNFTQSQIQSQLALLQKKLGKGLYYKGYFNPKPIRNGNQRMPFLKQKSKLDFLLNDLQNTIDSLRENFEELNNELIGEQSKIDKRKKQSVLKEDSAKKSKVFNFNDFKASLNEVGSEGLSRKSSESGKRASFNSFAKNQKDRKKPNNMVFVNLDEMKQKPRYNLQQFSVVLKSQAPEGKRDPKNPRNQSPQAKTKLTTATSFNKVSETFAMNSIPKPKQTVEVPRIKTKVLDHDEKQAISEVLSKSQSDDSIPLPIANRQMSKIQPIQNKQKNPAQLIASPGVLGTKGTSKPMVEGSKTAKKAEEIGQKNLNKPKEEENKVKKEQAPKNLINNFSFGLMNPQAESKDAILGAALFGNKQISSTPFFGAGKLAEPRPEKADEKKQLQSKKSNQPNLSANQALKTPSTSLNVAQKKAVVKTNQDGTAINDAEAQKKAISPAQPTTTNVPTKTEQKAASSQNISLFNNSLGNLPQTSTNQLNTTGFKLNAWTESKPAFGEPNKFLANNLQASQQKPAFDPKAMSFGGGSTTQMSFTSVASQPGTNFFAQSNQLNQHNMPQNEAFPNTNQPNGMFAAQNNTAPQNNNIFNSSTMFNSANNMPNQGNNIKNQGNTMAYQGNSMAYQGNNLANQGNNLANQGNNLQNQGNTMAYQANNMQNQGTNMFNSNPAQSQAPNIFNNLNTTANQGNSYSNTANTSSNNSFNNSNVPNNSVGMFGQPNGNTGGNFLQGFAPKAPTNLPVGMNPSLLAPRK